jgi:hypothetical protein
MGLKKYNYIIGRAKTCRGVIWVEKRWCKLFNVIALGQTQTYNINQIVIITDISLASEYCIKQHLGLCQFDLIN